MQKIPFLFLMLILITYTLNAQVSVRGSVKESNLSPVYFANISIHTAADSSYIGGTQTDSTGKFILKDIQAGNYILRVSLVGYRSFSSSLIIPQDEIKVIQLADVILIQDPELLKEVQISGQANSIRYEPDKMIMKVAGNSLFRTSTNAMDILRKAPGLSINPNGEILVSGRNIPVIFINGKPVPMSPEESIAFLNSLTPEMIDAIEIVANPSAKYDGQTKAIIDLKMKSNQSQGWKGNLNSSLRRHYYSYADQNLNLSYRSPKVTYALRAGYVTGGDFYQYKALQQLANTNYMATNTRTRTANNNLLVQFSTDYAISPNQNLELSLKTYRTDKHPETYNTLTFSEPLQHHIFDISGTSNKATQRQNNDAINLSYNINFSKDSRFNLYGSFSNIGNRQDEDIQIRDQLKNALRDYWKTALRNDIKIRNIQADYTKNMKYSTLEAGARLAFVRTNNDLRYDTLNTEQGFLPDAERTNRFVYDEFIKAGYISYTYKRHAFDFRLSLRGEHTNTTSNSVTNKDIQKRDYFTWLPSASLSYQLDGNQRLGLNFSRRMTRPDFVQLNPFRFYLSPLNYLVGNPHLRPSVTTSLSLSYNYKSFNINLAAGREKDYMVRYPEYNRVTNELLYLGKNLPYSDYANIETAYNFTLTKWWRATHNIGVYYNKQQMPYLDKTYTIGVTDFSINGSQVFTLSKDLTADLSYRYLSKSGSSLYIRKAFGSVDLGLQKNWLSGKLSTKLNIYDIFYTHAISLIFREKSIIDNQFTHRFATRRIVLTFGYNFGKGDYKNKTERSSEEEKRANR